LSRDNGWNQPAARRIGQGIVTANTARPMTRLLYEIEDYFADLALRREGRRAGDICNVISAGAGFLGDLARPIQH
jgi:hypothetical protein